MAWPMYKDKTFFDHVLCYRLVAGDALMMKWHLQAVCSAMHGQKMSCPLYARGDEKGLTKAKLLSVM